MRALGSAVPPVAQPPPRFPTRAAMLHSETYLFQFRHSHVLLLAGNFINGCTILEVILL